MAAEKMQVVEESPVDRMINQDSTPDFKTIKIVLTYPGYEPMIFELRRSLGPELRALQREFFGKTELEQQEKQQEFRVTFLSDLLRKHPEGVPGYPKGVDTKAAFRQYFADTEMDDMVDHIWVSYQNQVYPKELTLNASE